ncbi:MAG: methionyl-tRNA formyltransferase [Patescibacteria group bacterium]
MKYVFFGTPEFAAIIIEKLADAGLMPAAVISNPDRPAGRKKIMTPPPAKLIANRKNLKILQPENPSSIIEELSELKADFFVVAAYAKILPKEIIGIPRLGTIGVHPSLLPKYRGASPIQSVILAGETETGVTLYLMDEKMDHGPILENSKFQIPNSKITYEKLLKELAELAGNLLVETLPKFLSGKIKPVPQNESEATYTNKISTKDAFVDEKKLEEAVGGKNTKAAQEIDKKIRALTPEPGVWTLRQAQGKQQRVKLLEAEFAGGKLTLKKIQIEGQKPKTA